MRVITVRDLIRTVADRWKDAQLGSRGHWRPSVLGSDGTRITWQQLCALDLDHCSVNDVNYLLRVSNASWIDLLCDECGDNTVPAIVKVEQIDPWEGDVCERVGLCLECAAEAHAMIREANG